MLFLGRDKRPMVWNMAIMELEEHLDTLFQCLLLKIAAAMAAWATAWQKTSSVQTYWVF
jgi:hypothetical protein